MMHSESAMRAKEKEARRLIKRKKTEFDQEGRHEEIVVKREDETKKKKERE